MALLYLGRDRRKKKRDERRRYPLRNKPWKKEFRHQECALDKKLGENVSMEENKERERERKREKGSTKLKEEKGVRGLKKCLRVTLSKNLESLACIFFQPFGLGSTPFALYINLLFHYCACLVKF